nr:retrovirus-related Pol polyprotein from transposon TNT 1-94 [Tanacetum cinerariifolium]
MAYLSEDIRCAGSDTRPPMLDRTEFASWQQRIRLYCRGKKNGVNILKSIDEGPFQMETIRETLVEGNEGALHLGPERARVDSDLSPEDKERYNADIRATNILLQGLPKDIYTLINHYIDAKDIWDNVKMLLEGSELTKEDRESQLYDDFEHFRQNKGETIHDYYIRVVVQNVQGQQKRGQGNNARGTGAAGNGGAQNRVGNVNSGQERQIKCYNCNGVGHIARNCTQPKRPQNSEYFKDKMLLMQADAVVFALTTSESVHAGLGTRAEIEILAVVRYAGCGGGVATDSSVSNGSVSSADGAWSAVVGATTTESAGAGATSTYGSSSISGNIRCSWSSALGDPISDNSSNGLEISVYVTPDSSESDMTYI